MFIIPENPISEVVDKSLYLPSESPEEKAEFVSFLEMKITPSRTTKAKLMDVPLDLIRLDPNNIRFRHMSSELKDVQLERLIWKGPSTKRLYREIKWSKGLQEKPILTEEGDYFVVKEGNKRIVCLRKLKQEVEFGNLKDGYEFDPVRCVVLQEKTSREEEAVLLSRIHLSGKSQWGAFQKAAHIFDLIEEHRVSYDDINEGIGVSKAKASRMKNTFENMLRYKEEYDDEKWKDKYSYFYELEKRRYSRDKKNPLPKGWVGNNIEEFMGWVQNGQMERGEEVRNLPKIVKNRDAYSCLQNGGTVHEAIKVLADYDPTAGSKIFSKLARLRKAVDDLSKSEEKKTDTAKKITRINFLKELHSDISNLITEIEAIRLKDKK